MGVYVDDLLVKSTNEVDHIANLEESFNNLGHHWIKSNLNKCTFDVIIGMFLAFMVTEHGIETNLKKNLVNLGYVASNLQERSPAAN